MSARLILLLLQVTLIQMYRHQKPLEAKLWTESCTKNSMVLNDCNWCRCNDRHKYVCKARVCEEIDMFGYFKDSIQEIDVGMEGHGSWRSKPSYCTPGVHYRRGGVLCVCDEDGNWPNPVCRDLFQILHSVEIAGQTRLSKNESCSPTKLYLVGCNVCYCPSTGYLNPKFCTNKECKEDDPLLEADSQPLLKVPQSNESNDFEEIYASCDPKIKYKLGCRTCDCLRNNRLLCKNCTTIDKRQEQGQRTKHTLEGTWLNTFCGRVKPMTLFKMDCNLCYCDKLKLYCTIRTCIRSRAKKLHTFLNAKLTPMYIKTIDKPPHDDANCIPGTRYRRGCNTCTCGKLRNGVRAVDCTRKVCAKNLANRQKINCIIGTYYEVGCTICLCYLQENERHEICRINVKCAKSKRFALHVIKNMEKNVDLLRGRCEPMRKYIKDCNVCRCRPDGMIMACKSKICPVVKERSSKDVSVDVIPVVMKNNLECYRGHSFKLDCNLCFCLSNGNAICTTANCLNTL